MCTLLSRRESEPPYAMGPAQPFSMLDKRMPVFPTRMSLTVTETKLRSAERGHDLLKKKSDALQIRYLRISKVIRERREQAYSALRHAYISMSHAEYLGGNLAFYANSCRKSPVFVQACTEQASGVTLPKLSLLRANTKPVISLGKSGMTIMKCREGFIQALELLVELCALENSLKILESVFNSTNRRVNSLEFILIPTYRNTQQYIISELDEREREDFYRLKKIQNLKKNRP